MSGEVLLQVVFYCLIVGLGPTAAVLTRDADTLVGMCLFVPIYALIAVGKIPYVQSGGLAVTAFVVLLCSFAVATAVYVIDRRLLAK